MGFDAGGSALMGPLKQVYSVALAFRRPFAVVAKAVNEFLKAPVSVNLTNKSDLVLLNVAYHTITGSCIYPGRHPVLRPGKKDVYKFSSPGKKPSNCGYIVFELRESQNQLSTALRHYVVVGWRTGRFQRKPRVIVHIYSVEKKYSICTTHELLQARCRDQRCYLSSACSTEAYCTTEIGPRNYYTVNVAINDVLPATLNIEMTNASNPGYITRGYHPTCRGHTRYGDMDSRLSKPYTKRP
ncbi:hypothetical protein BDF19DRAFT_436195 [Syncephalis fuscata]|nr:hypothetical protein BDF19DRAFT_436195 [Syncephalis fuscata]